MERRGHSRNATCTPLVSAQLYLLNCAEIQLLRTQCQQKHIELVSDIKKAIGTIGVDANRIKISIYGHFFDLPFSHINLSTILTLIKKNILASKLPRRPLLCSRSILSNQAFTSHFEKIGLIEELLHRTKSNQDIPPFFLSIKKFASYSTCQLFIHEKGKLIADSFLFDRKYGHAHRLNEVREFNSLYNFVKKSKYKIFDQTQLQMDNLKIVGTFLAKEFELKNHNIILLISRNDFLPATAEEQKNFQILAQGFSQIFEQFLLFQQLASKQQMLQAVLGQLPFPACIMNNEQIVYHNDKHPAADSMSSSYPLHLNHRLILHNSPTNSSELYHFQRIALLGELLNTLQHELSNPLFGLKLSSNLLLADLLSAEAHEITANIADNCKRCQKIIENFSFLYKDTDALEEININKLIKESITLSKSATQNIIKDFIYHGQAPIIIKSNPTWLSQILFNLIVNSAQAINNITISAAAKITIFLEEKDSTVVISVSDTGPGIAEQIRDKIFSPFFTTKAEGTGLGLAICRSLVQKMGGRIEFQNNTAGPGATFSLYLPA